METSESLYENYRNFDVDIEPLPSGDGFRYRVTAQSMGIGTVYNEFSLSPTEFERKETRLKDIRKLGDSDSEVHTSPRILKEYGRELHDLLLGDKVGDNLVKSLDGARKDGGRLRIRIKFNDIEGYEDKPNPAAIPWEYLWLPSINIFPARMPNSPMVRRITIVGDDQELEVVKPPLRILAVISNPKGVPPLKVDDEYRCLESAIKSDHQREKFELERLQATVEALIDRMSQKNKPPIHVLHFIGHGYEDPHDDGTVERGLVFEGEENELKKVSAERLASILVGYKNPPQFVYLNACDGARIDSANLFSGVAQELIRGKVPAVVAMQFPVRDSVAIAVATNFYRKLAEGWPLDVALAHARGMTADMEAEHESQWGTPVLYCNGSNLALFKPDTSAEERQASPNTLNVTPDRNELTIAKEMLFGQLSLDIKNRTQQGVRVYVRVEGIPEEWLEIANPEDANLSGNLARFGLEVGDDSTLTLRVTPKHLEPSAPAYHYHLIIRVWESSHPSEVQTLEIPLTIQPNCNFTLEGMSLIKDRSEISGKFRLSLRNEGNADLTFELGFPDKAEYQIKELPPTIPVAAGCNEILSACVYPIYDALEWESDRSIEFTVFAKPITPMGSAVKSATETWKHIAPKVSLCPSGTQVSFLTAQYCISAQSTDKLSVKLSKESDTALDYIYTPRELLLGDDAVELSTLTVKSKGWLGIEWFKPKKYPIEVTATVENAHRKPGVWQRTWTQVSVLPWVISCCLGMVAGLLLALLLPNNVLVIPAGVFISGACLAILFHATVRQHFSPGRIWVFAWVALPALAGLASFIGTNGIYFLLTRSGLGIPSAMENAVQISIVVGFIGAGLTPLLPHKSMKLVILWLVASFAGPSVPMLVHGMIFASAPNLVAADWIRDILAWGLAGLFLGVATVVILVWNYASDGHVSSG